LASVKAIDDGSVYRCSVSNAFGRTRSARAMVTVTTPRDPVGLATTAPGLRYEVFEGRWPTLPSLDGAKPAKSGIVKAFDLGPRPRDSDFGMILWGFLEAATEGAYAFDLEASGIAKLFVAHTEVATAAGGKPGHGIVSLKKGKHRLVLLFAHRDGVPRFAIRYSGPNLDRSPISGDRLFYDDEPASLELKATDQTSGKEPPYGLERRALAVTLVVPRNSAELPSLLSQTGIFRSLTDLTPNRGIVPYTVNSPLWSDGATKRRWIALPGDARIDFAP